MQTVVRTSYKAHGAQSLLYKLITAHVVTEFLTWFEIWKFDTVFLRSQPESATLLLIQSGLRAGS